MSILQAVLGFAALSAVLTVIPGMDTTLVLRSTLTGGRRRAGASALGIVTGLLVWGCAAALGAAALLAASAVAFTVVTYAGVAYLLYLGTTLLVRSFRRPASGGEAPEPAAAPGPWRAFSTGLTTNLLNPKIGVFYVATVPHFLPAGIAPLGMGMLLTGVHVLLTVCWFALVVTAAAATRRWLAHARAQRIVDRVAGSAMVGLGAKLALQHR